MNRITILVNNEKKVERVLKHTDPNQMLKSIIGLIDFAEYHKGSAKSMAKDLTRKGLK